jgi:hypothetical protein
MYVLYIVFLYIFLRFFCVYVPLPSLRGQHMVLCHPRWLPTSGLTEFAVCWGGGGFEPRTTTDLQSGALPLSHLSSWRRIVETPATRPWGWGGGGEHLQVVPLPYNTCFTAKQVRTMSKAGRWWLLKPTFGLCSYSSFFCVYHRLYIRMYFVQ